MNAFQFLVTCTAIAVSPAIVAADSPMKVAADAPVEIADWSGAFAGLAFGYGSGDSDFRFSSNSNRADHSIDGGFAGIYGGYNWQRGQNVFGLDASYNASSIEGETACPNPSYTCYSEIEDFGAVRLRYGRILDNGAMIYGAAGYAFASVIADADQGSGPEFLDPNASLNGWTIALGAQKMLPSGWAMRGEISHTNYGATGPGEITYGGVEYVDLDVKATSLTLGFERHF